MCNGFYLALWPSTAEGNAQIYDQSSILGMFNRFGSFSPIFGFLERSTRDLHCICMKWSECLNFFFFFAILVGIEECSNLWKIITFRYVDGLDHFSQLFRLVKTRHILRLHEMIRVYALSKCVPNYGIFILRYDLGR